MMQWLMQNGNVIADKCKNDMFIMMLKRCLCGAWYECIYGHESPENHLSLLRIWGRSGPCVQLRRRYGSSGYPWQKTRPTYNACVTVWCRCAYIKRKENNTKGYFIHTRPQRPHFNATFWAWRRLNVALKRLCITLKKPNLTSKTIN